MITILVSDDNKVLYATSLGCSANNTFGTFVYSADYTFSIFIFFQNAAPNVFGGGGARL